METHRDGAVDFRSPPPNDAGDIACRAAVTSLRYGWEWREIPVRSGAVGVQSIVLHGSADATVHPGNGQQIVQHQLELGPRQTLQTEERGQAGGLGYCRTVTTDSAGVVLVERWEIDGLGHAWCGGSASGSYTDLRGPDASAEMVRFFLG